MTTEDEDPFVRASRDIRFSVDGTALVFRMWPGEPPAKPRVPLTRTDVLSWLNKPLPRTDACVDALVRSLNYMANTLHVSKALSFDPAQDVHDALQVLKKRLPANIRAAERNNKQHLRDVLADLLMATERADCSINPTTPKDHRALPWHDDAMWLVPLHRDYDSLVGSG